MADITLSEKFARAIQDDIAGMQKNIATIQEDVATTRKDVANMQEDMANMREDMTTTQKGMVTMGNAIETILATMATKEDLRKYATFSDVREIVSGAKNEILREIDPLRIRISRVEEKVGIVPAAR